MSLRKSSGSILRVGGGSRRKRGLTGSLAPTKPRLYDLEYQQLTEDFKDGLIGYKVYSEYLTEKMGTLQPDTLEWFSIKKKIDNITFQQIDKQMDYGFRVAKNITPDDYISWKEKQLEDIDPESNEYMQLKTDIKSAKNEKINRERSSLEFDILMETKNKEDLAKFYFDTANNSDDPESQMKYYGLYSKTVDGINADILKEERSARALEEKEMRLKFNRGDLGKTPESNIEAYYDFVSGQYESEFDPGRQMTYMSQLDSLTRQYEDIQEGVAKKAEQASAYTKSQNEKAEKEKFKEYKKFYEDETEKLNKRLEDGNLTVEEWAQETYRMLKGKDGYINDLYSFEGSQFLSDSLINSINSEIEKTNKYQDENSFFKAIIPIDKDRDGRWDDNEKIFMNPDYNFTMNFNKSGAKAGTFSLDISYDDSNNPYRDGYMQDPQSGLWYKTEKSDNGDRTIKMPDGEGGISTITEDSETGKWGTKISEEGKADRFEPSKNQFIEIDLKSANKQQREQYFLDKEFEPGITNNIIKSISKRMLIEPKGFWGVRGEGASNIVSGVKGLVGRMAAERPDEIAGRIIDRTVRKAKEDFSRLDEAGANFIDNKTEGLKTLAEESKARFIGEKGKVVKDFQEGLVEAGVLAKKFATGFFGPESQKATLAIKDRVQEDFSREKFKQIPRDMETIGTAISGAAKKYLAPKLEERIKPFQPTINKIEEKIKPLKGISAPINKKIQEFTKPFSEGIKSRFTLDNLKKIPTDIKTVGSYVKSKALSWYNKKKWW